MTEVHDRSQPLERSEAGTSPPIWIDPSTQPPVRRGVDALEFPTRHAELVVVVLAGAGGDGVDPVWLAELLWPGAAPDRARRRLRTVLWQARRSLGPDGSRIVRRSGRLVALGGFGAVDRAAVARMIEAWRASD